MTMREIYVAMDNIVVSDANRRSFEATLHNMKMDLSNYQDIELSEREKKNVDDAMQRAIDRRKREFSKDG